MSSLMGDKLSLVRIGLWRPVVQVQLLASSGNWKNFIPDFTEVLGSSVPQGECPLAPSEGPVIVALVMVSHVILGVSALQGHYLSSCLIGVQRAVAQGQLPGIVGNQKPLKS